MNSSSYYVTGAGRWFPASSTVLREDIEDYLEQGKSAATGGGGVVSGIAPHAGYAFSGTVAGCTYAALKQSHERHAYDVIIVLGFSHRQAFAGMALLDVVSIETPLGRLPVDQDLINDLCQSFGWCHATESYHQGEHSAENQYPFVQVALPGVPVVGGLVGDCAGEQINELAGWLARLREKRRIAVIASTDLLHDSDYERVCASDKQTLRLMEMLDSEALCDTWSYDNQVCCGIKPVRVSMRFADAVGACRGRTLFYQNSGDVTGQREGWVVGYGSLVWETE